jgi:hypothetical protein
MSNGEPEAAATATAKEAKKTAALVQRPREKNKLSTGAPGRVVELLRAISRCRPAPVAK